MKGVMIALLIPAILKKLSCMAWLVVRLSPLNHFTVIVYIAIAYDSPPMP